MPNTTTAAKQGTTRNGGVTSRQTAAGETDFQPSQDIVQYLKDYSRARPDVAAMWCFGIGFVVGWKLKPW